MNIRVLVVEDHLMVAELIGKSLSDDHDIEVLDCVPTLAAAQTRLALDDVDVVLMDHRLPDGEGIGATAYIREHHPRTQVIILTGAEGKHLLLEALRAGCSGFLRKSESLNKVALAIRAVHAGGTAISAETLKEFLDSQVANRRDLSALGEREIELLQLAGEGLDVRQIAEHLFISQNAVRKRLQTLLDKLDASPRVEMVAIAMCGGHFEPPAWPC